jgi:hypothetical protein
VLAETLRVVWTPPPGDTPASATLRVSIGPPGHWPARDWRTYPLFLHGANWESIVPVDTLEVPLIYFVEAPPGGPSPLSPLRVCYPGRLGLEMPTRIFWPFLEGFEESLESWRWLAGGPEDGRLQTSGTVKNGKLALSVKIPPGRASVTVGTTRVRGWSVLEHRATGVAVWIRTREGTGRARFAFLANAFATNQVADAPPLEAPIRERWNQIEVPFSAPAKFPLGDLDLFSIELLGSAGTEFLLDDLQLLGRWMLH